jgi:hypothetical protein
VDELPAVHAAVNTPEDGVEKRDEAVRRLSDQRQAPARVLFWFLAQVGRALTLRH